MHFSKEFPENEFLFPLHWAGFKAQILKTLIHTALTAFDICGRTEAGSGGMPSFILLPYAPSPLRPVWQYGSGSFEFAIAAFFAIVVMYDAIGVRRET